MRDSSSVFRPLEAARLAPARDAAACLDTELGPLSIGAHAPDVLRLRLGAPGGADYGLIAARTIDAPAVARERDGGIEIEAGAFQVRVEDTPLRVSIAHAGRALLRSSEDGHIRGGLRVPAFGVADGRLRAAFALRNGESVYGLGEKYGPLDRRGQLVTSWNEDALGVNAEASYKNVPFAWSSSGWGLYVNTTGRVRHGVGYPQWSHRSYVVEVGEPALDLFVLAAASPAAMLERFTALTGRTPPIPRWSFGAWMSRAYYRTEAEALSIAREIRARGIPCDVFTLDGRAWLKVETRFGFEWDASRYPDPASFCAELKRLDLRLCLWEYPYVSLRNPLFAQLAERGYLLKSLSGEPYVFYWDPAPFGSLLTPLPASGIVDFTNPAAYAWYRDAHAPLFAAGADVMKSDFGEQIPEDAVAANGDTGAQLHNVYPLLYNRCVYEATARHHGGEPFVWGRSGWTGSQTVPVQWGGDPQSDWEGLAASIRGGLSWGLSGVPFYSCDIGGFYGPQPDPELYVRWLQASVMMSHTRFHGTSPREPWMFGDEIERIAKAWLAWRYRLIPYLESCAFEAERTGLPVMRAMPLAFPGDASVRDRDEQYLLGPSLLVAPVVRPGGHVDVALPAGGWYDVRGGERVEGPARLSRVMPLDEIPIYAREGAVLPLGPAVPHTGALGPSPHVDEARVYGAPEAGVAWRHAAITLRRTSAGVWIRGIPAGARVRVLDGTIVETPEDGVVVRHGLGARDDCVAGR